MRVQKWPGAGVPVELEDQTAVRFLARRGNARAMLRPLHV